MMWKVNEPIWFNEISVLYILMQRGFWDSVVLPPSVCRGKIVLLLINVSLSQKWCHGNTENASMHCYCHMMWPQFIMTYSSLALPFSLAFFCEKSQNVVLFRYSFFFCIGRKNNLGRMFIIIINVPSNPN